MRRKRSLSSASGERSVSRSPSPPTKRERQSSDYSHIYANCPLSKTQKSIRVLTLARKSRKGSIQCTLKTGLLSRSLNDEHEVADYEALSYFWGNDEPTKEIEVFTAGKTFPDIFLVRLNLYLALQRLQHRDGERSLWIDAICINQDDAEEKNNQVSLMADVYSKAKLVCVWLGERSSNSKVALSFIKRVVNLEDFDRLVADDRMHEEWDALLSLMKRPWFSRRWVVQEIALATRATLVCGSDYCSWSDFADAVSLFVTVETESRAISNAIKKNYRYNNVPDHLGEIKFLGATRLVEATSNLFRKSRHGKVQARLLTLESLVSNLTAFNASRAHDVIYAVLSLAKDTHASTKQDSHIVVEQLANPTEPPDFPGKKLAKIATRRLKNIIDEKKFLIDYQKPFFHVCKEFLSATIQRSQSLDIICRPWVPQDGLDKEERPSWLMTTKYDAFGLRPDRSFSRKNADTLVGTPGLSKRNYNASGALKVSDKWKFGGSDGRSMFVEGFVIDTVREAKPYPPDGIILNEWLEAGGWQDVSGPPPDPFWRTLVADRGPNGENPPTYYPRACQSALSQSVEGGHISTNTLVHNGKSTVVAKFLRRVQEVIWMRKLIITTNSLLGLAPERSDKGDLICILYGCSVPVVLRKIDGSVASLPRGATATYSPVTKVMTGNSEMMPPSNGSRVDATDYAFNPTETTQVRTETSSVASTPILRDSDSVTTPTIASQDCYEFIGECYVHGIMDGEAFDLAKSRKKDGMIKKETFELR